MKSLKILLILVVFQLLLAGCVKQNLVVVLDIPGDYPVKQKLALAQGISQDVARPSFMSDVRDKFPSVSEKYLGGLNINVKQFVMSNEKKRDVAIEVRIEYKSGDLKAIEPMFDYVKSKVKSEIDYRIKHAGIEFLLAQDSPAAGYIKKEHNNPSETIYLLEEPVMTSSDIEKAILVSIRKRNLLYLLKYIAENGSVFSRFMVSCKP
jgi:hypothetical protein